MLRIADATMALAVRARDRRAGHRSARLRAGGLRRGGPAARAWPSRASWASPASSCRRFPGHFSAVGPALRGRAPRLRAELAGAAGDGVAGGARGSIRRDGRGGGGGAGARGRAAGRAASYRRSLDLRYRGQAHTLGVPLDDERGPRRPAAGRSTRRRWRRRGPLRRRARAAATAMPPPTSPWSCWTCAWWRWAAVGRRRCRRRAGAWRRGPAPAVRQVGLEEGRLDRLHRPRAGGPAAGRSRRGAGRRRGGGVDAAAVRRRPPARGATEGT